MIQDMIISPKTKQALGVVCIVLFSAVGNHALAQTATAPQFMVTWQAQNFAPADFAGKLLPIANTPIDVVFNVIENGKMVDLTNTEVRWYVNNKIQQSGRGRQTLRFNAPEFSGGDQEVRISIPSYKNRELTKTITIPVTIPQVIIQTPFISNEIPRGEIRLKALPYFFNISNLRNLKFGWLVNGVAPTSEGVITNPEELILETPAEIPTNNQTSIGVSIQNKNNTLEAAARSLVLKVTK
jgi:hypothetical protein